MRSTSWAFVDELRNKKAEHFVRSSLAHQNGPPETIEYSFALTKQHFQFN